MRITPRSPSSCFSSGATSTRDSCPSARPTSRISASASALPKCAPPPLALPASEHPAERHHPASLAETFSKPHFCRVCFPSITDRKSTRLNSSHGYISYAVFCLKKKKKDTSTHPTNQNHH